jgi:hypothetical protein
MWQTMTSCRQCEKLSILVEAPQQILNVLELPNTYDPRHDEYVWKFHEFFGYALVPCVIDGTQATIDVYFCVDQDDLDDIDVRGYAMRFLSERISVLWKDVRILRVSEATLAFPVALLCRKPAHVEAGETR